MTDVAAVNRELAIMVGFLFAACLVFGFMAWTAMNYVESDIDRFHRWIAELES